MQYKKQTPRVDWKYYKIPKLVKYLLLSSPLIPSQDFIKELQASRDLYVKTVVKV